MSDLDRPTTLQEFFTDRSKWCKGVMEHYGGACCLLGAARKVYLYRGEGKFGEVWDKIRAEVVRMHGPKVTPPHWNDRPTTTFADVKALVTRLNI